MSLTPYLLGGKMAVLTPQSQQLSWPDNNACLLLTAAGIVQRWERWIQRQEAVHDNKQYLVSRQWNVCEVPPLSSDKTQSKNTIFQHHHHHGSAVLWDSHSRVLNGHQQSRRCLATAMPNCSRVQAGPILIISDPIKLSQYCLL